MKVSGRQPPPPQAPPAWRDLGRPESLARLNAHLELNSYIEGFKFGSADSAVHRLVPQPVLPSFPHISRWYRHIAQVQVGRWANPVLSVLHGTAIFQFCTVF